MDVERLLAQFRWDAADWLRTLVDVISESYCAESVRLVADEDRSGYVSIRMAAKGIGEYVSVSAFEKCFSIGAETKPPRGAMAVTFVPLGHSGRNIWFGPFSSLEELRMKVELGGGVHFA